jgi:formylglycine-generating enzyme required for sulfatase activity
MDVGGDVIGDYAWYSVNSGAAAHPVGTTGTPAHANELGLYDMSGNVYEWCWDWYAAYPAGALSSDTAAGRGAVTGTQRVDRGGGWNAFAFVLALANRTYSSPSNQGDMIGFRVVRP